MSVSQNEIERTSERTKISLAGAIKQSPTLRRKF